MFAAADPTTKLDIPAKIKAAGKMKYIGPITPGELEDVPRQKSFTARGQEIYSQIIELNPKFNPKDFKFDDDPIPVETRDLEERNKENLPSRSISFQT